MKKAFLFIAFILLLIPNILFAGDIIGEVVDYFFGTSENCDLIYLPRTFVNNANVMIELSQAKSVTITTTTADYANSDDNHQAMFRLRDTLEKNAGNNNSIILEITSDNGWNFVNESNAMETRPFSIGILCFDREHSNLSYNSYTPYVLSMGSSHKTNNNGEFVPADPWTQTTTLSQNGDAFTVSFDGTKYTVTIPTTTVDNSKPDYMRDIDFCIVLDETISTLESGYYSTTLHVSTNKKHSTTSGTGGPINETINLRGYVGTDPGQNNATYSFLVSSSSDTYSMNFEIPNHETILAYDVASVRFLFSEIVSTEPNIETEKTKFKIYISPTPDYSSPGQYRFIKLDSDNQARNDMNTVYYDLYIKTGDTSFTAMNSTTSSTVKAEGIIGSWGRDSTVSTTYYMHPQCTYSQVSSSAIFAGEDKYQITWELDQKIWLKINDSTHDATYNSLGKIHNYGMYWSYIYLTLETTT